MTETFFQKGGILKYCEVIFIADFRCSEEEISPVYHVETPHLFISLPLPYMGMHPINFL